MSRGQPNIKGHFSSSDFLLFLNIICCVHFPYQLLNELCTFYDYCYTITSYLSLYEWRDPKLLTIDDVTYGQPPIDEFTLHLSILSLPLNFLLQSDIDLHVKIDHSSSCCCVVGENAIKKSVPCLVQQLCLFCSRLNFKTKIRNKRILL